MSQTQDCQFIHIQAYARTRPKNSRGAGGKWSVEEIVLEALRDPRHCRHIPFPETPTVLFGEPEQILPKMERMLERDLANRKRDGRSKKIRVLETTPVLLSGIASYPNTWAAMTTGQRRFFKIWLNAVIKWANDFGRSQRGELVCALLHTDEAHPHIHLYWLPTGIPGCKARMMHPGWMAKAKAKEAGLDGAAAYRLEMRAFQRYFENTVSYRFGHEHLGPERRRRTRRQVIGARMAAAERERIASYSVSAASGVSDGPDLAALVTLRRVPPYENDALELTVPPNLSNEGGLVAGSMAPAPEPPEPELEFCP